jgi:hypothetical protein
MRPRNKEVVILTEVKVERTPELGSMKETLGFLKEVAKESVIHQTAMTA